MNEEFDSNPAQQMSAFLPLTLLAVCLLLSNIFQLSVMLPQRSELQRIIAQNDQGIAQSQQAQAGLQKLVEGLLGAAKDGDKDAQAIITKHNIRINGEQPGTAAPATPVAPK